MAKNNKKEGSGAGGRTKKERTMRARAGGAAQWFAAAWFLRMLFALTPPVDEWTSVRRVCAEAALNSLLLAGHFYPFAPLADTYYREALTALWGTLNPEDLLPAKESESLKRPQVKYVSAVNELTDEDIASALDGTLGFVVKGFSNSFLDQYRDMDCGSDVIGG